MPSKSLRLWCAGGSSQPTDRNREQSIDVWARFGFLTTILVRQRLQSRFDQVFYVAAISMFTTILRPNLCLVHICSCYLLPVALLCFFLRKGGRELPFSNYLRLPKHGDFVPLGKRWAQPRISHHTVCWQLTLKFTDSSECTNTSMVADRSRLTMEPHQWKQTSNKAKVTRFTNHYSFVAVRHYHYSPTRFATQNFVRSAKN